MFTLVLIPFTMLASLLATRLVIRLAPLAGLVDQPNQRSSHSAIVPHGGGIGMVLAGSLGLLLLDFTYPLVALCSVGFLFFFLGLIDDIRHLSPVVRISAQCISLFLFLWWLGDIPVFGSLSGWPLLLLVLLAGLWWVNLFNFMDGIDGIAAAQAICMLGIALLLVLPGHPVVSDNVSAALVVVIAAAAGFLVMNWAPAKIFMGDVGSLWLGFAIFGLGLLTIEAGWLSCPVWLILGAVFVTDATVTLIKRLLAGERWYEAHRSHVYQQLAVILQGKFIEEGINEEKARAKAHRRVVTGLLAVNLLWLAPLAWFCQVHPALSWGLVPVAYLPLAVLAVGFHYRKMVRG